MINSAASIFTTKPYDTFSPEELALAREPMGPMEEKAFDLARKIERRLRNPWYRMVREIEPYRANLTLLGYPNRGKHLRKFADESGTTLLNFKIIQLTKIIRRLKPRLIYEFGAGASTALFAELLDQNYRLYGIQGHIISFEQSPQYHQQITEAFPDALRSYSTIHLCPVIYECVNDFRTIRYALPPLPAKTIDFAYIDGPAPVSGNGQSFEYPIFSGDLINLAKKSIFVRYAVNDGRWFNLQFFRDLLGNQYLCTPTFQHKSFVITLRQH